MTASVLARVAPAMVLAGVLAAGVAVSGHAQTPSAQPGTTAPPPATTPPPAMAQPPAMTQSPAMTQPPAMTQSPPAAGATTMPGGTAAPQAAAPQTPAQPGAAAGAATTPQGGAPAATARSGQRRGMSAMVDRRIADLRERLQITQAQEPQWSRFAEVMRSNARRAERAFRRRSQMLDQMNALENMESYARIERGRVADVQRLVPAFHALYVSLTPEQRRVADDAFRERSERRRGTARK